MQEHCAQDGKCWYALHTKPRKEHAVQEFLLSRGIETYLPVLKEAGKNAARNQRERPFFSCYLFARVNLNHVPLSSLNWAPGVNRVVSFGGQPAVVPDEVVDWLKCRLAQIDARDYYQGLPLQPGDRLRVVKGPLKDLEAIFDRRLSSGERARVFIEILGRLTICEVNLNHLQRVEK
jgi:transcriptional antiterminator RfaH